MTPEPPKCTQVTPASPPMPTPALALLPELGGMEGCREAAVHLPNQTHCPNGVTLQTVAPAAQPASEQTPKGDKQRHPAGTPH